MDMVPGRIVHFQYQGEILAAIITCVNFDGSANICAFSKAGTPKPFPYIKQGEDDGTWHWPRMGRNTMAVEK